MMEKIQKLKQGKIDPNELLKSFSKESPQTIQIVNNSVEKPKPFQNNENSRVAVSQKGSSMAKQNRKGEKTEPHKKSDE